MTFTLHMLVIAVFVGFVSANPSSRWCTGREDAPTCGENDNDRCVSEYTELTVGKIRNYKINCPANEDIFCSFFQFKSYRGNIDLSVPGTYGLNFRLTADPVHTPEQGTYSCYELPSRTSAADIQRPPPLNMSYYFDHFNARPSPVKIQIKCDSNQSNHFGFGTTTTPPSGNTCIFSANIQCSCGRPVATTTLASTTTTITDVPRLVHHSSNSDDDKKGTLDLTDGQIKLIAGSTFAFLLVIIIAVVVWARRKLVRKTKTFSKHTAPPFHDEESDIALLDVDEDDDFIISGVEDNVVWRIGADGKPVCSNGIDEFEIPRPLFEQLERHRSQSRARARTMSRSRVASRPRAPSALGTMHKSRALSNVSTMNKPRTINTINRGRALTAVDRSRADTSRDRTISIVAQTIKLPNNGAGPVSGTSFTKKFDPQTGKRIFVQ